MPTSCQVAEESQVAESRAWGWAPRGPRQTRHSLTTNAAAPPAASTSRIIEPASTPTQLRVQPASSAAARARPPHPLLPALIHRGTGAQGSLTRLYVPRQRPTSCIGARLRRGDGQRDGAARPLVAHHVRGHPARVPSAHGPPPKPLTHTHIHSRRTLVAPRPPCTLNHHHHSYTNVPVAIAYRLRVPAA